MTTVTKVIRYTTKPECADTNADLIRQRFEKAADRLGMRMHGRSFSLDTTRFEPPMMASAKAKPGASGSRSLTTTV